MKEVFFLEVFVSGNGSANYKSYGAGHENFAEALNAAEKLYSGESTPEGWEHMKDKEGRAFLSRPSGDTVIINKPFYFIKKYTV